MITRFQVKGFKNLFDAELSLGPVTCIAGLNGVGKSNFFDALILLKALADKSFVEAASEVRGGGDPRNLFSHGRDGQMSLSADLLIPDSGIDDFNQPTHASSTFVTYEVALRLDSESSSSHAISLERESLKYITKGEAAHRLPFPHSKEWLESVVKAGRRTDFISTDVQHRVVKLHQDRPRANGSKQSSGGRTFQFPLGTLPRTVLSSANNAQESQTAVLVRRELRSFRLLQLEPAALRKPDDFHEEPRLAADGAHLAATLYRLTEELSEDACTLVAN
ncbi:MAG: AAA family ATPase, partial [Candidatus Xenobia bacterium]